MEIGVDSFAAAISDPVTGADDQAGRSDAAIIGRD